MGSKSVLILGIVFIFLLNVVAVHNYIDSYYYQPKNIVKKKENKSLTNIFKKIKVEDEANLSKIDNNKKINDSKSMEKKIDEVKNLDKNLSKKEDLITFKGNFYNQLKKQEHELELMKEKKNQKKEKLIEQQNNEEKTKNVDKVIKKDKDKQIDESEKNAFIVLNLDIENPYDNNNPVMKKMAQKMSPKRVIKVKIYKYSMKIKNYIEKIKSTFVDYGIDIDNIKVSYTKDDSKQNKIKILLTKKD